MGYPGKERQQQLRAAKGAKGNNVIREERRAARAGICEPNTISKLQTLAQDSSSSAAGSSFGVTTADLSAQQQLVFLTAPNASPSTLDASVAVVSFATPSTNQAPPADNASRSHATSQQPFAARIAAVAARRTGGRHHRRSRVPSQKERLSRRIVFRDLTGVPLAALGLSHNLGGSVAADIVGNWPSEVLGEELLGSDDEEEEDMKDDDEGIEDMEDDDDEEMPDVRYDSDIYDSDGNEWAALGVNMKEGRP
ncbi:uncharacterized protein Bfra_001248 [Botrytis fragariae]|uniref:Uncharacterized protein n=1 Tax=Botrytis fragariae TaxID=1964551 RepID=A0A8H6AZY8_9HELO|nr:uncharacterized protein Bfra_001248 [Botrytis fragariae]KAF5876893.1 hypothetical protein Bfra_001248 [Botrytis fragariae]